MLDSFQRLLAVDSTDGGIKENTSGQAERTGDEDDG